MGRLTGQGQTARGKASQGTLLSWNFHVDCTLGEARGGGWCEGNREEKEKTGPLCSQTPLRGRRASDHSRKTEVLWGMGS